MKKIMILLLPLILFWGGCDRNSRIIGYWASDVNLTITSLKKLMADSSDIFEKERYRMYIESLEKGEGLEHMPLALQSKFIIKIEGNGKMIFFMNDSKKVGSYSTKSSSKIIGNLGGRFSMTLDGEALRMIPLGQLDLETGFPIIFSRTSPPVSEVQPEEPHAKTKPLEPVTVSPNLKYEIKDGMVTITDCVEKVSGELTIPATIEGKPVTGIGWRAFYNCTSLTNITIPDSVISIGSGAFSKCINLTSITIPDGVTSIGRGAFYSCTNLTNIIIPDSVTIIGRGAFLGSESLKTITIPDKIKSIADDTFSNCRSLTSITIPENVTSIGKFAFSDCTNLTSITIPDSVTSIGRGAFTRCTNLTSITIPNSVTSIGFGVIYACNSLTAVTFLGHAPEVENAIFRNATPTIYRKPEAKGWGDTFGGRPVKLISAKP